MEIRDRVRHEINGEGTIVDFTEQEVRVLWDSGKSDRTDKGGTCVKSHKLELIQVN